MRRHCFIKTGRSKTRAVKRQWRPWSMCDARTPRLYMQKWRKSWKRVTLQCILQVSGWKQSRGEWWTVRSERSATFLVSLTVDFCMIWKLAELSGGSYILLDVLKFSCKPSNYWINSKNGGYMPSEHAEVTGACFHILYSSIFSLFVSIPLQA